MIHDGRDRLLIPPRDAGQIPESDAVLIQVGEYGAVAGSEVIKAMLCGTREQFGLQAERQPHGQNAHIGRLQLAFAAAHVTRLIVGKAIVKILDSPQIG